MTRAAAAVAAAAALVLAAAAASAPAPARPTAEATLSPAILLFGDDLAARVDVVLDARRADAGSVRVEADFAPWALVGRPVRERLDGDGTTIVRTTYRLRCLIGPCVPPRDTAPLRFDPARVSYRDGGALQTLELEWPLLVVHSRLTSVDAERGPRAAAPWRIDAVSLPPASYRLPPLLALALLAAAGTAFAAAAAVLGYRALPRRAPDPEPEPEPEPEEPALSPLQHALALLEGRLAANGAAAQRRALELVAEEVAARDAQLARRARVLAWSEAAPAVEVTSGIAERVRAALGVEEEEAAPVEDA